MVFLVLHAVIDKADASAMVILVILAELLESNVRILSIAQFMKWLSNSENVELYYR